MQGQQKNDLKQKNLESVLYIQAFQSTKEN